MVPSKAAPPPDTAALRRAVLEAGFGREAASAYKAYFLHVGRAGLRDLMQDENTGIALQAAWETHLKPARRKEKKGLRTDDVYDTVELEKFVAFFRERTQAPVPSWWAETITDVDLFPGQHHAFAMEHVTVARKNPQEEGVGWKDPQVRQEGGSITYMADGRAVEFPKDTFPEDFAQRFTGWLSERRSVVAAYSGVDGHGYTVAGFEGKGGTPVWKACVWAAGRSLGGVGYHRVEMTQKEGVAYLFGVESHGAYAEAFDVDSGKALFRFCSCYWFNNSEAWGLQ